MTSAEDRAEALSYQYESAFKDEDNTSIPDKGCHHNLAMEQIVITVPKVVKLLQSINPKKAIGPDLVPSSIFKDYAQIQVLYYIIH